MSAPVQHSLADFPVSLVQGIKADVIGISSIFQVLQDATTSAKLRTNSIDLRAAHQKSKATYKRIKENQPGFVVGKFSYRSTTNCLEYFPVIGFDLDHLEEQTGPVIELLKAWDYTLMVFPSISGGGVRLFVRASNEEKDHAECFRQLAQMVHKQTKLPLKSVIRDGLKIAGLNKAEQEKILETKAHIDDSVGVDIARFWFYSGMDRSEIFINKNPKIYLFEKQVEIGQVQQSTKPVRTQGDYDWSPTEEQKVEYCITQLERGRIDITGGVREWHKVGHALYSEFGTFGESYFMRVCAFHPEYSEKECLKEWVRVGSKHKPVGAGIASFYAACSEHGIRVDFKYLRENYGPSKPFQQSSQAQKITPATVITSYGEKPVSELERCVLATALLRSDLIDDIYDEVPSFGNHCFLNDLYREVYKEVELLRAEGKSVNPAAVMSRLSANGSTLTRSSLDQISQAAYYPTSVGTNTQLVFDAYRMRELAKLGQSLLEDSQTSTPVEDLLESTERSIGTISDTGQAKTETEAYAAAALAFDMYQKIAKARREGGKIMTGVTTGIPLLDELYGGRQAGHLLYQAARPGMGKTLKMLWECLAAAKSGVVVGILSLEMPTEQLINRMLAVISGLPLDRILKGTLSPSQEIELQNAAKDFAKLDIIIDDRGGQDIAYMSRTAKRWKRTRNLGTLWIDYIQLADLGKGNNSTNDKVGALSKGLKNIAKNNGIPVNALSQLSRAVETMGSDKRPQLSHLRDSGNLEQDADMVEFLYRPEYYKITEDEQGNSLVGALDIIVSKNRHGALKDVRVRAELETQRILEWDQCESTLMTETKQTLKEKSIGSFTDNELEPNQEKEETKFYGNYGSQAAFKAAFDSMDPADALPFD